MFVTLSFQRFYIFEVFHNKKLGRGEKKKKAKEQYTLNKADSFFIIKKYGIHSFKIKKILKTFLYNNFPAHS